MLNRRALRREEGICRQAACCRAEYGLSCFRWGCGAWILASAVSPAPANMAGFTWLYSFCFYNSLFWVWTGKGSCLRLLLFQEKYSYFYFLRLLGWEKVKFPSFLPSFLAACLPSFLPAFPLPRETIVGEEGNGFLHSDPLDSCLGWAGLKAYMVSNSKIMPK